MNVKPDHGETFTTEFPDIQIYIESSTWCTCAHTQNHCNMKLHLQLEKYQYAQQEGVGKHNICSTEKKRWPREKIISLSNLIKADRDRKNQFSIFFLNLNNKQLNNFLEHTSLIKRIYKYVLFFCWPNKVNHRHRLSAQSSSGQKEGLIFSSVYLHASLLSVFSVFPPSWLLGLDPFSCLGSCWSSGSSSKAFLRQIAANSMLATGIAEDCPSLKEIQKLTNKQQSY